MIKCYLSATLWQHTFHWAGWLEFLPPKILLKYTLNSMHFYVLLWETPIQKLMVSLHWFHRPYQCFHHFRAEYYPVVYQTPPTDLWHSCPWPSLEQTTHSYSYTGNIFNTFIARPSNTLIAALLKTISYPVWGEGVGKAGGATPKWKKKTMSLNETSQGMGLGMRLL